jgi:hypothetical protein
MPSFSRHIIYMDKFYMGNAGFQNGIKFRSLVEFWDYLPAKERIITDVLRQIVLENLPAHCKEKLSYNVPFYYGKRRICLVWLGTPGWF